MVRNHLSTAFFLADIFLEQHIQFTFDILTISSLVIQSSLNSDISYTLRLSIPSNILIMLNVEAGLTLSNLLSHHTFNKDLSTNDTKRKISTCALLTSMAAMALACFRETKKSFR